MYGGNLRPRGRLAGCRGGTAVATSSHALYNRDHGTAWVSRRLRSLYTNVLPIVHTPRITNNGIRQTEMQLYLLLVNAWLCAAPIGPSNHTFEAYSFVISWRKDRPICIASSLVCELGEGGFYLENITHCRTSIFLMPSINFELFPWYNTYQGFRCCKGEAKAGPSLVTH